MPIKNLKIPPKYLVVFLFLGSLIIILDQLFKKLAINYFAPYPVQFGKYLYLEYFMNDGIAFGLPLPSYLMIILLPLGFILLFWHFLQQKKIVAETIQLAFLLLFAGGLSNLLDRFVYGQVIDYITISGFTIFNLADLAILYGAVLLLIHELKTIK
ncbi:MAG: signal peptidase II [bacterium]